MKLEKSNNSKLILQTIATKQGNKALGQLYFLEKQYINQSPKAAKCLHFTEVAIFHFSMSKRLFNYNVTTPYCHVSTNTSHSLQKIEIILLEMTF